MKYTPQQEQAITTRSVSVALAAGAGCGKTFVLTQRFVAQLVEDPSEETLSGLMAITFTDRAAREMRDRIRETVRQQLAGCSEEEAGAWETILRELESARIQTVHSFCTATLRSHATELGMDPDFAVLDEPTASAMLNQAVQTVLEQQLREKNEQTSELVLRYGLEGVQQLLQMFAKQRFRYREAAQIAGDDKSLINFWLDHFHNEYLPKRIKHFADSAAVQEVKQLLGENSVLPEVMQQRRAVIFNMFDLLNEGEILNSEQLAEMKSNAVVLGAGKKKWDDESLYESVKNAFSSLRKSIEKLLESVEFDNAGAELAAKFGLQLLRLSELVIKEFQEQKQQRAALDFDDLILMMRDLLEQHPAVTKQLQQTTQFLMLDEFQDTDPVQTQIVKSVCGDRLTTGGLFLVGDVKQSIYRFRRADPTVFQQLRRQIPEAGRLSLTQNFRSQQEILDFVNFLFGPEMGDDYDDLHAFDTKRYLPKAKTEFLWSSEQDLAGSNVDVKRKVEAEWIASRISELLDDPTPCIREKNLQSGETELRRVEPGDIVILFRAFSNLAVYEDALKKSGVDYYVVGGRAFFAQQEIYDFVNLCKFLDDDTDEVSLAGILRSPLFSWSDDCLMLMKQSYETLLQSILADEFPAALPENQQAVVANARRVLGRLLTKRTESGIGQLLRHAVHETAYDAALLCEFLGERKVANLQKLIEMADDFDRIGLLGLSEFADRLLESISEEAREELAATYPETGNVVRLMTVHQSKGLEFPIVIVADVNRSQNSNTDRAVLSPQLGPLLSLPAIKGEKNENPAMRMYRFYENCADEEEAIRLFYVATTRAADRLILSAFWNPDEKMAGAWMKLLNKRFHLETGLPKGDSLLGQSHNPGFEREHIPEIEVIASKPEKRATASKKSTVRLSDWNKLLEKATPISPPIIALPLPANSAVRERFSVSELEATDEQLQEKPAPTKNLRSKKGGSLSLVEAGLLGDLVHAAAEKIDPANPIKPEIMISQIGSQFNQEIPEKLQQMATTRLGHLLNSPILVELKEAKRLFRETEFLLRFDHQLKTVAVIAGTVDCLVQDQQDNWHLIDYKTGTLAESSQEVMEKYGLQMTLYAIAIKELTSSFPKSIRIVQLAQTSRLVELDLTTEVLDQFKARIVTAILHLRSEGNK